MHLTPQCGCTCQGKRLSANTMLTYVVNAAHVQENMHEQAWPLSLSAPLLCDCMQVCMCYIKHCDHVSQRILA